MPTRAEPTEAEIAYGVARDDLAVYLALTHRTDDGSAAMPPRHLLEQVIPAIEDDSLGDTVIIAPPGSIKTNTLMGAVEWWLGRDPAIHCGYVCSTGPEAAKRSLAIRDMIELSPHYRAIFPSVAPNKNRGWAQDAWYLERPNIGDKNPSLLAVGVGGALIGARLHRLVYDDLSDDENTKTELQRKAVWRFLAEIGKTRMHPTKGRQVMIGTRQHEEDAIGYALDRGWHVVHIPALDEGKSYWEEYHPAAWLACPNDDHSSTGQCCMKRELGALGFARQYLGIVYNEETTRFSPNNWRRYAEVPDKIDNGGIFIDTAGWSQNQSGSDFAVLAAWARLDGDFYCLEVRRGRWLFTDVVKQAIEMQAEWGLRIVVEETVPARPLIDQLKRETWGVVPWPIKGRSKVNRADAASPAHEAGQFWIPVKAPWVQPFIDEHAAFPDGKYDDQVDTTTMMYDYLNKNRGRKREEQGPRRPMRNWGQLSA